LGIYELCAFKTYIILLHYLRVFLLNFQLQKTKLAFFFSFLPPTALSKPGGVYMKEDSLHIRYDGVIRHVAINRGKIVWTSLSRDGVVELTLLPLLYDTGFLT